MTVCWNERRGFGGGGGGGIPWGGGGGLRRGDAAPYMGLESFFFGEGGGLYDSNLYRD